MEKIFCFSVLLLSGLVGVNSLQCFVCFNCTTPGADDLKTCGVPVTTTQTPTVPTTTGIPSSPSTTISSTTIASSTTASSINPSTTTASATTPSTTIPATTTPSITIPSTTSPSTTIPATTTTSITVPSITTPSTTTTAIEPPVEPAVEPPVDLPVSPELERRLKRNVMSPVTISRVSKAEDIEYVCYKVTAILNSETVIERGCAPAVINDKELCENDVIKNVTTSCRTCKTDKCNSSYAVQFSTALLAAAVVGLLFCQ